MKIAMQLYGFPKGMLEVIIMQMVRLVKDGQEFKMSKRSGQSLTLNDLLITIGKDAARWFLVSQPADSHLEIDVDKATKKDNNNALYYVQYAYARINQVLAKSKYEELKKYDNLTHPLERELLIQLSVFPNTLAKIAESNSVNILTVYLVGLAKLFHSYYAQVKLIDPSAPSLTKTRMGLIKAIQQVIANGLVLMDIKPTEKM